MKTKFNFKAWIWQTVATMTSTLVFVMQHGGNLKYVYFYNLMLYCGQLHPCDMHG